MNPSAPTPPRDPNQPSIPLPAATGPAPVVPGSTQPLPAVDKAFDAHGGNQAPLIDPQEYDFIMNPPKVRRGLNLDTGNKSSRLALIAGGGVALIIVLMIFAKLFSHPNPLIAAMTPVAQQQQELLHLTSQEVAPPEQLSTMQTNFVATTTAVMTSASLQLNTYLAENKVTLNPKLLGLKIDPVVDQQLTSAQASGIFQSTYTSVTTSALQAYAGTLQTAEKTVNGPNGRAYLESQLKQAQLLYQQLKVPVTQTPATS